MTRGRILILLVCVASVAAALLWKLHRRDETVGAASRPRPAVSHGDVTVGAASRSRSGPASTPRPHPATPADEFPSLEGRGVGFPKTHAQPTGLGRVHSIINAADSAHLRKRGQAVRTISTPLTQVEIEAFYHYLLTPARNSPDQEYENWLRNEMLDVMLQQPVLPSGYSDLLVVIYNDAQQDVVMRDYAVQHMAPAFEQSSSSEQAKLEAAMWQATRETDSSLAGTALLALLDVVSADGSPTSRIRPS